MYLHNTYIIYMSVSCFFTFNSFVCRNLFHKVIISSWRVESALKIPPDFFCLDHIVDVQ